MLSGRCSKASHSDGPRVFLNSGNRLVAPACRPGRNLRPVFDGFETVDVDVAGVRVHASVGGSGQPVLLLHGYPQTHVMWHRVAPVLARGHTVVAADLRGYGDSAKPPGGADHREYAKQTM